MRRRLEHLIEIVQPLPTGITPLSGTSAPMSAWLLGRRNRLIRRRIIAGHVGDCDCRKPCGMGARG